MKPKTKQMLDMIISDPKISQTEAYLATHKTKNRRTAKATASQIIAKPNSQIYLQKHISKARQRIVQLIDETAKPDIALRASQDILDRHYGKPIQKQLTDNTHRISISLGSTGVASPSEPKENPTPSP